MRNFVKELIATLRVMTWAFVLVACLIGTFISTLLGLQWLYSRVGMVYILIVLACLGILWFSHEFREK